jgi:hypothetical protein
MINEIVHDEVSEYIQSIGVPGALVMGNNRTILPPEQLRLNELRDDLRAHLRTHAGDLKVPMKKAFSHPSGKVASVHASTRPGVMLTIDRHDHGPGYKESSRSPQEIEAALLSRVEDKVEKAKTYGCSHPLWLAIRYPIHVQIRAVSDACRERVKAMNSGVFSRIILFNDPEHVLDAAPPGPHFIDLLV